jgi:hypothetical protein
MYTTHLHIVRGLNTIALGTLLVSQSHGQQWYVDGFVTAVTTSGFQSGGSTVLVTGSTRCFQTIVLNHQEKSPIPCASFGLSIASHFEVAGVKEASGCIKAKELAIVPPSQDAELENGKSGGPSMKGFRGGAFLEESPRRIESGTDRDDAILWINGVQLEINRSTKLRVVAGGLTRHDLWEQDIGSGFIKVHPRKRAKAADTPSNLLVPGVYVSYQAAGRANRIPLATSLNIFPIWRSDKNSKNASKRNAEPPKKLRANS